MLDPARDPRVDAFVAAFDDGRFFDAHEHLEELWQEYRGPDRDALRGLVQVAVALEHRARRNRAGAGRVGARAVRNLKPWFPTRFGFDLEGVARDLEAALRAPDGAGGAPAIAPRRLGRGR